MLKLKMYMDKFDNGYSINGIANYNVGKKFFVVPEKKVTYAPNHFPIVCPIGVFELVIKEIVLYPQNNRSIKVVKIVWDTNGVSELEGTEQISYITLNKDNDVINRDWVNFSEKEAGANNMYHQKSKKTIEHVNKISVELSSEINRCLKVVAENDSALNNLAEAKKLLNME